MCHNWEMPDHSLVAEHLFREKYWEILTALLRSSGYEQIDLAEEAVRFAFQRALEKWLTGLPDMNHPESNLSIL